jgi:flagellar hook protein FlgE
MAGISGLKMHQVKMDVIGNNIANVNTVGYKAARANFKEIYASTLSSASAPDSERGIGGTNPAQVGLGISLNSISMQYTDGNVETTDNKLDVAIDGDGLFIVKNNDSGEFLFTRAGMFDIDKLGNLVTASGARVYGWMEQEEAEDGVYYYNTEKQVEPINIYSDEYSGNKKLLTPQATDKVSFTGNLKIDSEVGVDGQVGIPISIFDSYGTEYTAQIVLQKSATDNVWTYSIEDGQSGTLFDEITGTIEFDTAAGKAGKILNVKDSGGNVLTDNKLAATIDFIGGNQDSLDITFDFGDFTQYDANNSAKVYNSNGYTSGELVDYSIGDDGIITGIYSNGKQQALAMIGLARFDNPQGLKKMGDSLFAATPNSGNFIKAVAPKTTAGALVSNSLEMSNVDLSKEFTDIITTQRGFQANSKIITTSDELLQELVNLKR